jgi:hypothetical protein
VVGEKRQMLFANIAVFFFISLRPLRIFLLRGVEISNSMWHTCRKLQGAVTAPRFSEARNLRPLHVDRRKDTERLQKPTEDMSKTEEGMREKRYEKGTTKELK